MAEADEMHANDNDPVIMKYPSYNGQIQSDSAIPSRRRLNRARSAIDRADLQILGSSGARAVAD